MNSRKDTILPFVFRFISLIFFIAPVAARAKTACDTPGRDQRRALKSIVQGL